MLPLLAARPSELLDTIGGLPLHPLIVHAAVVLLPLGAVALIAIILIPRWRAAYGWPTIGALAIGAAAALAAASSGEALAERVGEPERHADLGETLQIVAVILFLVAAVWFFLQRRAGRRDAGRPGVLGRGLQAIAAIAAIALAAGTLGLTVLVGHSGAEAVWLGRVSASATGQGSGEVEDDGDDDEGEAGSDDGAATTTTSPSATSPAGAATVITLADVAARATASECWAAIDGTAYDLTAWIDQHPGGREEILGICGTDATAAFSGQHAGDDDPARMLAGFAIGPIG